jgi:chromate transporter
VAVGSFVALAVFALPFPFVVLAAAGVGWLGGRWVPEQFARAGGGHAAAATPAAHLPAVIDDHTPTPDHARFSRGRLVRVLLAGLALWALPMATLVAWQGAGSTLVTMGGFFTKAALLTFGGAYAVLPYVYQGAVVEHGWLLGPQMIDGLALGETTPGPLIMVVAFVAFLGGWGQQVLGPDALFLGGALAALVVTWFTFLPSFIFILAGGPMVEGTHGQLRFTAPLTAITAAVVGVIASLALFFLYHVAYPSGLEGGWQRPDVAALVLAGLAALALIRFRQGVIRVIVVCALLGWAWRSLVGVPL